MVGRLEIAKDTAQVVAESAATHVGRIATILSGAVREVTHEIGEWASDVIEMRDAAEKARADGASDLDADAFGPDAADPEGFGSDGPGVD